MSHNITIVRNRLPFDFVKITVIVYDIMKYCVTNDAKRTLLLVRKVIGRRRLATFNKSPGFIPPPPNSGGDTNECL